MTRKNSIAYLIAKSHNTGTVKTSVSIFRYSFGQGEIVSFTVYDSHAITVDHKSSTTAGIRLFTRISVNRVSFNKWPIIIFHLIDNYNQIWQCRYLMSDSEIANLVELITSDRALRGRCAQDLAGAIRRLEQGW